MMRCLPLLLSICCAGLVPAQVQSVVPSACASLPGNAALSMPLRWSHGTMQVRIESTLLPANFIGRTITSLRLRRPSFLGEPAYPALQRTLTVRGAFHAEHAWQMGQDLVLNRTTVGAPILFGPAVVSVAATSAPPAGASVGEAYLVIPLATPLPVIAGNLFLEFETSDAPLQVSNQHWVDAVWFEDGIETGYAVPVGNGSCTTRTAPTELVWTGATGPQVSGTASLRLSGAPPGGLLFSWVGLDPVPRAATPTYMGFGGSFGALDPGLAGCHQWAPVDALWSATADLGGGYNVSFALAPTFAAVGTKLGVQCCWLDLSRPGLPFSASNGVMLTVNQIGVANKCTTVYFPGTATWSPWLPFYGQMPVLTLEHS